MRPAWLFPLVGAVAGFFAGPELLTSDVVRTALLALGFVAASILPSITLLVNGLTATGRSVKAVNELHSELRSTVAQLFSLLLLSIAAVVLLAFASAPLTTHSLTLPWTDIVIPDPAHRATAALAFCIVGRLVDRASAIPASIYRSLELRRAMAVEDARRKIAERVDAINPSEVFPTSDGFGERLKRKVGA